MKTNYKDWKQTKDWKETKDKKKETKLKIENQLKIKRKKTNWRLKTAWRLFVFQGTRETVRLLHERDQLSAAQDIFDQGWYSGRRWYQYNEDDFLKLIMLVCQISNLLVNKEKLLIDNFFSFTCLCVSAVWKLKHGEYMLKVGSLAGKYMIKVGSLDWGILI